MRVEPYLTFQGRAEEAINFYRTTLDARVEMMMRFRECPTPADAMPLRSENLVMHASILVGESRILCTDGGCNNATNFEGFTLALEVKDKEEAERLFEALGKDGVVEMPMAETFFSPAFGIVRDRFQVSWMVNVAQGEVKS